ncbi:MAG: hypothetical protein IAI48_11060 [Candidatus Eremiobacteraeota bacterium]|nr:hypothetical protein [Candidatus Eremiobacteraeota bacterium]
MTDQEVQAYDGKAVRVTLADGRVIAGTLHADDAHGHGHVHYVIVSDGIEGAEKVSEMLHGASAITEIADASNDPAAVE